MNKSCIDDVDIEDALERILEDTLKKSQAEDTHENRMDRYEAFKDLLTDPEMLNNILRQIKKANSKISDDIKIMEELEKKELQKKARDQEEAERNEKLKNELMKLCPTISGFKVIPEDEELMKLVQVTKEAIKTRKQQLLQYQDALQQLVE